MPIDPKDPRIAAASLLDPRLIDAMEFKPVGSSSLVNLDGRLGVAFMDPVAVLQMTSNPEVARVAHKVRGRLERVKSALVQGAGNDGE